MRSRAARRAGLASETASQSERDSVVLRKKRVTMNGRALQKFWTGTCWLQEVQRSIMFAQTRKSGRIVAAILLLGLIATAAPVRAELITGSDYVDGIRQTAAYDNNKYGPYWWQYGYTINFDGTVVEADVQINFVFDSGLDSMTPQQKAVWKADAATAIEAKWNDEHSFEYDGVTINSVVDVAYDGPFDRTVIVMAGDDRADLSTWYWDQRSNVSAHEFGHMLGLYDEYWGGALNPDHFLDTAALMGTVSGTPAMPDRYYQPFVDFVHELQQIPEPATTTMIVSGVLMGLALLRRT